MQDHILWVKFHLRGFILQFCSDLANMHLNKKTLEYTERETCGSFLLIMHLFPKQINRRITQTNITHRTASVERPIPDEERRGGRESLFVPSATVCNIHIAEIHNSPKKIHPRPSPPLSTTVGNMEPGNPGSYEQLLDVMVSNTSSDYTLDSGAASLREGFLDPST